MIDLYHGSQNVVEVPLFGKGNPHNDYGLGFYCTQNLELAKEWSCLGQEFAVANHYRLDADGMTVLDLNRPQFSILNWLAILLENRTFDISLPLPRRNRDYFIENFLPDYKKVDIIRGYRADDSYFSFARDFLNNSISLAQLKRAMALGRLGEQIVLKSFRAIDSLEFVEALAADGELYLAKRMARDNAARTDYAALRSAGPEEEAVLAVDIVRQKWTSDDPRLR